MPVAIKIEDSVLIATIEGDYTLAVEKELTERAAHTMQAQSLSRLILDFRAANIDETASITHIYYATQSLQEHYPSGTKFAIVSNVSESDNDASKFFEDVAFNRGIRARVFSDIESAKNWLT